MNVTITPAALGGAFAQRASSARAARVFPPT